ncbi:MAG: HD-GYP domain-containing protein [Sulfurimonas sp.]|nr:HD-GYP domain-containing protein [Sulfurimonas sp.]
MTQNIFFKHLQHSKEEEGNGDDFLKVQVLYNTCALHIKKVLSDISCARDIELVQESAKSIVEFINKDCCTIESLTKILEHDYYTHSHCINVGFYAIFFGKTLKLTQEELEDLGSAALLHDLGKSKIDVDIINKNGKLTDYEFANMKEHPRHGYELAKAYGITNSRILIGIKHHHERLDGYGYPDNLLSDEIKLFPKIIAMCDVFDALTTKRSYKEAMSSFEAFKIMKSDIYHFDQKLLKKFMHMMVKN